MTTTDELVENRIDEHMNGRSEHIGRLYEIADGNRPGDVDYETLTPDEARTHLDELPLDVSQERLITILLSTGGPEEFIEVKLDGNEILSVTFCFRDWFQTAARRTVEDTDPLWRYAEEQTALFPV